MKNIKTQIVYGVIALVLALTYWVIAGFYIGRMYSLVHGGVKWGFIGLIPMALYFPFILEGCSFMIIRAIALYMYASALKEMHRGLNVKGKLGKARVLVFADGIMTFQLVAMHAFAVIIVYGARISDALKSKGGETLMWLAIPGGVLLLAALLAVRIIPGMALANVNARDAERKTE